MMPLKTPADTRSTKKAPGRPEKYTLTQFGDALKRARGLVEAAARLVGCESDTLRSYMEKYPELRQLQRAEKEFLKDAAELKLLDLIQKGRLGAICFFLKTQAKDRGYIERQEYAGPGGGPIPVQHDLSKLPREKLLALQEILALAENPGMVGGEGARRN